MAGRGDAPYSGASGRRDVSALRLRTTPRSPLIRTARHRTEPGVLLGYAQHP